MTDSNPPPGGPVAGTTRACSCSRVVDVARDLEHDIKALADRARSDREFAVELYGALCNASWHHEDGTDWPGASWRSVADVVAHLRGCGENYLDF